jgi:phosphohistidine phosphatase SixA
MSRRRVVFVSLAAFLTGVVAAGSIFRGIPPALAGVSQDGDVNGDGALDLADPIHLLRFLFQGGPPPVPCPASGDPYPTLVVLVRHAEREQQGADPCLLPEGTQRAERLARIFANVKREEIGALVASEKCRTKKTLEPLSLSKGALAIEPIEGTTNAETASLVADRLRGLPRGSLAVVAHHSFTLLPILEALGVADTSAVDTNVFDNFLLLQLPEGKPARMVPLTYF